MTHHRTRGPWNVQLPVAICICVLGFMQTGPVEHGALVHLDSSVQTAPPSFPVQLGYLLMRVRHILYIDSGGVYIKF